MIYASCRHPDNCAFFYRMGCKLLLVTLFLLGQMTWAEDWPTYMHDNARSGVTGDEIFLEDLEPGWVYNSPAPPQRAFSDGPQWDAYTKTSNVPQRDFDTAFFVTVVSDSVYFGSSVTNSVHCLDSATGRTNWVCTTDGPVRFPPTYYQGKLYFGSDDGYVYCINALDGSFIWQYSPAAGHRLVCNNGNLVTMWPIRTGVAVMDGKAYFAASLVPWKQSYLCAVDAETGSASGFGLFCKSGGKTPVGALLLSQNNIYLPQGRFYPQVFDRASGSYIGSFQGSVGVFALLTANGNDTGFIYGGGRNNDKPGYNLAGVDDKIASVLNGKYMVVAGDVSYVIKEKFKVDPDGFKTDYQVYLDALDRNNNGATLWGGGIKLDSRAFALIMADGKLFVGETSKVAAYSTDDGSLLWQKPVEGHARALAAAGGRLYVSTDTGKIYMFGSISSPADFDHNGIVDILDLEIFVQDFLKSTNPGDPAAINLKEN